MRGERRLNPRDLIKTARHLLQEGNSRPRQANLHRAISTAYYAMFHALALNCANLLVGSDRTAPAWRQVYKALSHGFVKKACQSKSMDKFPQEIQDFANMFCLMQVKRHEADYDPKAKAAKSSVAIDIDAVEAAINDFSTVAIKDRRAFAALILFKQIDQS